MHAVTFNAERTGRQECARVGHVFQCHDGARLKVLAIDSGDPTCVLLEGGRMLSIPCGSIVRVEAEARPRAARTVKETKPVLPTVPVHPGQVRGVAYHHGPYGLRTIRVGDYVGNRLVVSLGRGDPCMISLLDAKGLTTSVSLCGAGSIARWSY